MVSEPQNCWQPWTFVAICVTSKQCISSVCLSNASNYISPVGKIGSVHWDLLIVFAEKINPKAAEVKLFEYSFYFLRSRLFIQI